MPPEPETATDRDEAPAASDLESTATAMRVRRESKDRKYAALLNEFRAVRSRKRPPKQRALFVAVWLIVGALLLLFLQGFSFTSFLLLILFLLLVLIVASGMASAPDPSSRQIAIIEQLTDADDIQAIGSLLRVVFGDPERGQEPGAMLRGMPDALCQRVFSHLIDLLSRVRESDRFVLPERDLLKLYACVASCHSVRNRAVTGPDSDDLAIAMLQAVGEVGRDQTALNFVSRLNSMWAGVVPSARVQDAIDACVARITARMEAARRGDTLLRAAQSPAGRQDDLLRPANSARPETDGTDYLRAVERIDK